MIFKAFKMNRKYLIIVIRKYKIFKLHSNYKRIFKVKYKKNNNLIVKIILMNSNFCYQSK